MAQLRFITLLFAFIISCSAQLPDASYQAITRPRLLRSRNLALGSEVEGATLQRRAEIRQEPTNKNSIIDLRMLATQPGNRLSKFYGYDDSAGQGITIIMIDVGPFGVKNPLLQPLDPANQYHTELQPPDPSITRENIDFLDDPINNEEANSPHGTCMASKAVGQTVGVARRSNLITVRVDLKKFEDVAGTFKKVSEIIKEKGLQGKAVVSTALITNLGDDEKENEATYDALKSVMEDIIADDVPIICSAGNYGEQVREPDTFPAILAADIPLIVVGSVDSDGNRASYSQRGKLLTTSAVGTDILCADQGNLNGGLDVRTGTSAAASFIAGLSAYFMAAPEFKDSLTKGNYARDMQKLLRKQSYKRQDRGWFPPVAWNGFTQPCSKWWEIFC